MLLVLRHILIRIIRFARYHLLLVSNSTFITGSMFLGTIQICPNLSERYHYLVSTPSVIWLIDADCSPVQSLNMYPFHMRLEHLKLTYFFSKYYFKTGTIYLLLSSHVFIALEFDNNHFGIPLWKIVKPHDPNGIKQRIGKIFRKYKPIRHYFVIPPK